MGYPKVTINVTGEITRPVENNDGVTGFLFYNDNVADLTTLTAAFNTGVFETLADVVAEGITVASTNFKYEYYVMSEYFRMGGGKAYINVSPIPAVNYDFTELDELKNTSAGEINTYAVCANANVFDVTDVALIDAFMVTYSAGKKDAIALYAADYSATTISTLTGLTDLRTTDKPYVSVVLGQDTYYPPNAKLATPLSEANIGAVAGAISSASVEVNILSTSEFNYSNGGTLASGIMVTVGFVDSTGLVQVNNVSDTNLDTLHDYGYIYWRYLPNLPGTYLSNDSNSGDGTGTFTSIHIMRQRNKANRQLDSELSKLVGSKLYFTTDGYMTTSTIDNFYNRANAALGAMLNAGEISNYSLYIDPKQNSITTKTVTVNASIIPVESADNIVINVAWVATI